MGLRKKKSLLDQAEEYVEAAIDSAKDFIEDTAKPAISDAKVKAAPVVAAGAADIAERASSARQLAEEKAAEVTGKKKKRSKVKMFLLFGLVAGAVAAVAKKLQAGGEQSSPWQSDYTPPPAPTAVPDPVDTAVDRPVAEEDVVPPSSVDPTANGTGDPLSDPIPDEQKP